jgi:hypothetical protein
VLYKRLYVLFDFEETFFSHFFECALLGARWLHLNYLSIVVLGGGGRGKRCPHLELFLGLGWLLLVKNELPGLLLFLL